MQRRIATANTRIPDLKVWIPCIQPELTREEINSKFTQTVHLVKNAQGLILKAVVTSRVNKSEEGGGVGTGLLICHGMLAHMAHSFLPILAGGLLRTTNNHVFSHIVQFDFAGMGESQGLFEYGGYKRMASDIESIIQFFFQPPFNINFKFIIGHSMGAMASILHSCLYSPIRYIIPLAGRFDTDNSSNIPVSMEELNRNGQAIWTPNFGYTSYIITKETIQERCTLSVKNTVTTHSNNLLSNGCSFMIVHGSLDDTIAAEDSLQLSKLLDSLKIVNSMKVIEGADHFFKPPSSNGSSHNEDYVQVLVNHISQWMEKVVDEENNKNQNEYKHVSVPLPSNTENSTDSEYHALDNENETQNKWLCC